MSQPVSFSVSPLDVFPLQVPDECDVRGAKSVVQRGRIPDAPPAGHHSAQQGETVGEGERDIGERRTKCVFVCACIFSCIVPD